MTENEGSNYTKEDLRHFNLSNPEIKELNGHELGDGEEDSDILSVDSEGNKFYRAEDPGAIYKIKPEEDNLLDLRKRQFWKIEDIKEKMKKNGDERHLFFIKEGTLVESSPGFKFFRGHLKQDVLAVKEKKVLELIPLLSNGEIKISHPKNIEAVWKIRHFNTRDEVIKLDLMNAKIDNPKKLNEEILSLNKK